jgi:uncharacterized protein DUF6869
MVRLAGAKLGAVDQEQLIAAFWRHYRLSQSESPADRETAEESFWAWEEAERVAREPNPDTVGLFVALVDAAPDDQARCYFGAGPLEDLLLYHGPNLVDEVEEAATRHERFRTALGCVWYGTRMDPRVTERFRDLKRS